MGKTALLEQFGESDTAAVALAWLRCDQLEQDIAFAAAELLLGQPVDLSCSELEVERRLLAHLADGGRPSSTTSGGSAPSWASRAGPSYAASGD